MQAERSELIPLVLVTGFLGAGKTTLMQGLAQRRRLLMVVNEFAPRDIDSLRLEAAEGELYPIAGGSIFCRCKVQDFISALEQIAACWDQRPGLDGVAIEASGIADPRVAARMLTEAKLDDRFTLRRVLCVVDPSSCSKLLTTLPNIAHQIAAADTVLINHCDRHDEASLAACERSVRELAPEATVVRTSHCAIELDPLAPACPVAIGGEYAGCADPNYAVADGAPPKPLDWPRLRTALDEHAASLYRIKGNLATTQGVRCLDFAGGVWHDSASDAEPGTLVLIGAGSASAALNDLAYGIRSGRYCD
ncbi:MAG: GTP-binding protein [Planctomycetota bacterium]|jgi:Ni2+-binding GTPase involved in maturation of urease and hydrogenase|nr:GTP-binding protein [Planctomycetota bacterium]